MRIFMWSLALLLLATATWDFWVHRNALATAASRTSFDRNKYFTKTARSPFVFVSRYTETDASLGHEIRIESTEAADSKGRADWENHVFNPSTDAGSAYDSAGLIETSTGKIIGGFSRSSRTHQGDTNSYSIRSACIGSIEAARLAGRPEAATASRKMVATATATTSGSNGST